MQIVIVGAGRFGREVADWLKRCKADVAGFIDDEREGEVSGLPVLSTIDAYQPQEAHGLLVSVGEPEARERIANLLEAKGAEFTSMCADGIAAHTARWGDGLIMCPFSVLSAGAVVGRHVHVNISLGSVTPSCST